MNDKTLLKFAFCWSLIGIVSLVTIAFFTVPEIVDISSLENELGKTVIIQGEVTQASYTAKVTFFDIDDGTGKVTAVLFEPSLEQIKKDNKIQVKGKVEYYKDKLEIIADEVVCLEC